MEATYTALYTNDGGSLDGRVHHTTLPVPDELQIQVLLMARLWSGAYAILYLGGAVVTARPHG